MLMCIIKLKFSACVGTGSHLCFGDVLGQGHEHTNAVVAVLACTPVHAWSAPSISAHHNSWLVLSGPSPRPDDLVVTKKFYREMALVGEISG